MNPKKDSIMDYLQNAKELSVFCSQNGWIINESINYEVLQRDEKRVLIYTTFLESIMEGSGCQCDQKSCYGRLLLTLDDNGAVVFSEAA